MSSRSSIGRGDEMASAGSRARDKSEGIRALYMIVNDSSFATGIPRSHIGKETHS